MAEMSELSKLALDYLFGPPLPTRPRPPSS